MHTWAPDRFRAALTELRRLSGLSDTEIARLAGKSRSQVNRWTRAENQPNYGSLRQLATALSAEGYSDHVVRAAHDLLYAAGYESGTQPAEDESATDGTGRTVRFTVMVNPEEPEPDYPPGGLRDQVERIIWALDEPWQAKLAQIEVRRAVLPELGPRPSDRTTETGT